MFYLCARAIQSSAIDLTPDVYIGIISWKSRPSVGQHEHQVDHILLFQKRACRIILGSSTNHMQMLWNPWALLSAWTTALWFWWKSDCHLGKTGMVTHKFRVCDGETSEALINLIHQYAELLNTGSLPYSCCWPS